VWKACVTDADKVLIALTGLLGMRVSEATHLNATWIRGDRIYIPDDMPCSCSSCARSRAHPYRWRPKNKAGARELPVIPQLRKPLGRLLQQSPKGLGISRAMAHKRVLAISKRSGVAPLFPHVLRATAATNFSRAGMSAQQLCYTMGWSEIEIGSHYIQIAQAKDGSAAMISRMFPG